MSRNICDGDNCYYCYASVRADEKPRLATKDDVGRYTETYEGRLWVAHATCPRCEAKYLAWYSRVPFPRGSPSLLCEDHIVDLSFRSTFNDEPGPADKPRWVIRKTVTWIRLQPYTGDEWSYPGVENWENEFE